jgi:predicted nuclease with RNAse H fold
VGATEGTPGEERIEANFGQINKPQQMIFGIDYGSRMSGNTAICWNEGNEIKIIQVKKKSCADQAIKDHIHQLRPSLVAIDAPLSLPGVYYGRGDDYFYRDADKKTGAMSPMFIGGLTARAIKLKDLFDGEPAFIEIYPSHIAKTLGERKASDRFKNKNFVQSVYSSLPIFLSDEPKNIHQFDSLLAWWVGYLYTKGETTIIGDPEEGAIHTIEREIKTLINP